MIKKKFIETKIQIEKYLQIEETKKNSKKGTNNKNKYKITY